MSFLATALLSVGDELQKILDEVIDEVGTYGPRILAALAILFVGWIIAKIIKGIVRGGLRKIDLNGRVSRGNQISEAEVPDIEGSISIGVYYLVLLFTIVAAFNALGLDAITDPTSDTLDEIVTAFPDILAAFLVLGIAFMVGRIVSIIVSSFLTGFGFNNVPGLVGLNWDENAMSGQSPSQVMGLLIFVAFMLFAAMEAASLLGFGEMAVLLRAVIAFSGRVLVAVIVFGVALYLGRLFGGIIRATGVQRANLLAVITQVLILYLAGAIALRTLGIANDIIALAFGVPLAAAAVAFALAFGLGGRDAAARQLQRLEGSLPGQQQAGGTPNTGGSPTTGDNPSQ